MRRLVVIPVKMAAVVAILAIAGVFVGAEARQAVVRRQQTELARIENQAYSLQQTKVSAWLQPVPPRAAAQSVEQLGASPEARGPVRDGHTRQIVISIAFRRLALVEDGKVVKTYPIAVGTRRTPSPEGEFVVVNHAKEPTYRHNGKEILPGRDNPLGTRWMGLSLRGYGIHGTNVPATVGKAASHGCFRMKKQDVEDLYSRVRVGDTVIIRRQRDEMISRIFAPGPEGAFPVNDAGNGETQVATASPGMPAQTDALR